MARLFVGIWPPADVVSELTALPRKDRSGVRFVAPENWHVTLRFLGEARPDEVIDVLDRVTLPAARARLGPSVDIVGDRALVLPVSGLDGLAAAVAEHTAHIGAPQRRRFAGHLTIARVKRHVPMPPVLGTFLTTEFEVGEVALVESRLQPQGARYTTIGIWPTV